MSDKGETLRSDQRRVRTAAVTVLISGAWLLQACSMADDDLATPAAAARDTAEAGSTGDDRGGGATGASRTDGDRTAPDGDTAAPADPGVQPTDTPVGERVGELAERYNGLRSELAGLRETFRARNDAGREAIQDYRPLLSEIRSRLQLGTTPGNPELVTAWNEAQQQVGTVTQSADQLAALRQRLDTQAGRLDTFLNDVADAFTLSGGLERDHEDLARLQDAGRQMLAAMTSLDQKLETAIKSRRRFVEIARADLRTLARGIQGDVAQRAQ